MKSGNTFTGWNTAANGSGITYAPGATFAISSNTTLYAQWSPITFTLNYDDNGSTGGAAPIDGASPYVTGTTVTVLSNTGSLVKSGNTFTGWNTAANGSGITYAPGATFAISSNTTLYAQWSPITFTLNYDDNGSTGGAAPIDGASPLCNGNNGDGAFQYRIVGEEWKYLHRLEHSGQWIGNHLCPWRNICHFE